MKIHLQIVIVYALMLGVTTTAFGMNRNYDNRVRSDAFSEGMLKKINRRIVNKKMIIDVPTYLNDKLYYGYAVPNPQNITMTFIRAFHLDAESNSDGIHLKVYNKKNGTRQVDLISEQRFMENTKDCNVEHFDIKVLQESIKAHEQKNNS